MGLLLAVEAVRIGEGGRASYPEAEEALRWALSQSSGRALESGRVSAVGTTADRRFLVTAGIDGTARLWDLAVEDPGASGRILAELDEGAVSTLTMTNDQKWLLTRGAEGRIFLRDLTLKEGTQELPEEGWFDAGQPFSPDSRWLLTHQTGEGRLRDLKTGDVHSLGRRDLRAAAFSPDSRWLATAFQDGHAEFRDLRSATLTLIYVLPEIGENTELLEFSPKGDQIRAVNEDGTQRTWELDPTGRPGIERRVTLGQLLQRDATWPNISSMLSYFMDRREDAPLRFGSFSSDGRWVITQKGTEPPVLWAVRSELSVEPLFSLHGFDQVFAMSRDSRFLLGRLEDNILLLDLTDNARQSLEVTSRDLPFAWTLSVDGSWVAWTEQGTGPRLLRRMPAGFSFVPYADRRGIFFILALSSDGRWLASADSWNGTPFLWSLQDPQAPEPATGRLRSISKRALHPPQKTERAPKS